MKPEEATQTKDGTPVRIYATDGKNPYPIHGAMLSPTGWGLATWTAEGHCVRKSASLYDLDLTDWRDEIPWDYLVPEIKYVARDEDGDWCGYETRPEKDDVCWDISEYNYSEGYHQTYGLKSVKMPHSPADWKQAIAKRPD